MSTSVTPDAWTFDTMTVVIDGPVLFAEILAPPMNLLGPEDVRDSVSLIQRAETQRRIQAAMRNGLQTRFAELDFARIVDELVATSINRDLQTE